MSSPAKPGWPESGTFPFMPFQMPGASPTGQAATSPLAQPLMQGLSGGVDLIKKFWGNLPGGTQVPGFLLPTVDLEELDKRIADLRAAESWVEVNLNMLRATIQGLEVQRNTIAAIQSLSAMADQVTATKPATPTETPASAGLQPGWPAARSEAEQKPQVEHAAPPTDEGKSTPAALPGLAAGNWLGYLQDQFTKVAQAALVSSAPVGKTAPTKKTSVTRKAASKKAATRKPKPAIKR